MAKITIDGIEHEFEEGKNLFEACAEANGEKLPHFCYHPGLSIAGVCRMCQVEIEGVTLDDVSEVPRAALRENDRVFVLTGDSTLAIKDVEVLWGDADHVLVTGPLDDGDQVVVSPLATPVDGMKLKTLAPEEEGKEARRP